jgi:hypothetical protein
MQTTMVATSKAANAAEKGANIANQTVLLTYRANIVAISTEVDYRFDGAAPLFGSWSASDSKTKGPLQPGNAHK